MIDGIPYTSVYPCPFRSVQLCLNLNAPFFFIFEPPYKNVFCWLSSMPSQSSYAGRTHCPKEVIKGAIGEMMILLDSTVIYDSSSQERKTRAATPWKNVLTSNVRNINSYLVVIIRI
jgi:hypothetical protein